MSDKKENEENEINTLNNKRGSTVSTRVQN